MFGEDTVHIVYTLTLGGLPFQCCFQKVKGVRCISVTYSTVQCSGTNLFSSSKRAGLGWRKPCSDMVTH